MGATAPWTERLKELVHNGPVPFSEVLSEVAGRVPPGRAFRTGFRHMNWKRKEGPVSERSLTSEQKDAIIHRGAVQVARSAIWTERRAGHLKQYLEGGVLMLAASDESWQ